MNKKVSMWLSESVCNEARWKRNQYDKSKIKANYYNWETEQARNESEKLEIAKPSKWNKKRSTILKDGDSKV